MTYFTLISPRNLLPEGLKLSMHYKIQYCLLQVQNQCKQLTINYKREDIQECFNCLNAHNDRCYIKNADSVEERVKKGECPHDQGGYFIVKGSQKVIVAQERMAHNQIYVFHQKTQRQPWTVEIRSVAKPIGSLSQLFKMSIKIQKHFPRILCKIKNIKKEVPLGLVLRALGIESDEQILQRVCQTEMSKIINEKKSKADISSFKYYCNMCRNSKIVQQKYPMLLSN